jgi:hypothetical protein
MYGRCGKEGRYFIPKKKVIDLSEEEYSGVMSGFLKLFHVIR